MDLYKALFKQCMFKIKYGWRPGTRELSPVPFLHELMENQKRVEGILAIFFLKKWLSSKNWLAPFVSKMSIPSNTGNIKDPPKIFRYRRI